MSAVRAKATTGFISGKQATTGRRVKPWARRAGATTSSALQIVGVSQAVRALRAAALGRLGMVISDQVRTQAHRFIGNAAGPQAISRRAFPAGPIGASSRCHPLRGEQ